MTKNINSLPRHILEIILQMASGGLLEINVMKKLALVCKYWREICTSARFVGMVTKGYLPLCWECPSVIRDLIMNYNLSMIRYLDMSLVIDEDLAEIPKDHLIQSDEIIHLLSQCQNNLQRVRWDICGDWSDRDDDYLPKIVKYLCSNCHNVERLDFSQCTVRFGDSLSHLNQLKKLSRFSYMGYDDYPITVDDLGDVLPQLESLRDIHLERVDIGDRDYPIFQKCDGILQNLERLSLVNCKGVEEVMYQKWHLLRKLRRLDLFGTEITNGDLMIIGENCKLLWEIELSMCIEIDSNGLCRLRTLCPGIKNWYLERTPVCDVFLKHMCETPGVIERINLRCCSVSPRSVARLVLKFPKIRYLNIMETEICCNTVEFIISASRYLEHVERTCFDDKKLVIDPTMKPRFFFAGAAYASRVREPKNDSLRIRRYCQFIVNAT